MQGPETLSERPRPVSEERVLAAGCFVLEECCVRGKCEGGKGGDRRKNYEDGDGEGTEG